MARGLKLATTHIRQSFGRPKAVDPAFGALAALLLLAVVLGGGGVRYAIANLAVQLAALLVLALRREAILAFLKTAPLALRLLVGASVLLPILQLIPLPPYLWQALPGRDLVAQSF